MDRALKMKWSPPAGRMAALRKRQWFVAPEHPVLSESANGQISPELLGHIRRLIASCGGRSNPADIPKGPSPRRSAVAVDACSSSVEVRPLSPAPDRHTTSEEAPIHLAGAKGGGTVGSFRCLRIRSATGGSETNASTTSGTV